MLNYKLDSLGGNYNVNYPSSCRKNLYSSKSSTLHQDDSTCTDIKRSDKENTKDKSDQKETLTFRTTPRRKSESNEFEVRPVHVIYPTVYEQAIKS